MIAPRSADVLRPARGQVPGEQHPRLQDCHSQGLQGICGEYVVRHQHVLYYIILLFILPLFPILLFSYLCIKDSLNRWLVSLRLAPVQLV